MAAVKDRLSVVGRSVTGSAFGLLIVSVSAGLGWNGLVRRIWPAVPRTLVNVSVLRLKPQVSRRRRSAPNVTMPAASVSTPFSVRASQATAAPPSGAPAPLEREADGVAADVGQGAAAERGVHPDVGRVGEQEVEGAVELGRLADRAVLEEAREPAVLGLEGEHERLPQRLGGGGGDVEDVPGLGRADAERLLAQHRLARLQRPDRGFGVQGVGQRDVDGVDVR